MKTIGLLGGMSWESTALYYRLLNEMTRARLGGLHSAPIVLVSVDFQQIETLQMRGDWVEAGRMLAEKAVQLERGGADCLLICTNTMHKVADEIAAAVQIPLLHLADATAVAVKRAGLDTVGLLGTAFTMEQTFYRGRLEAQGLKVLVPGDTDRQLVHRIIYDELCMGEVLQSSKSAYLRVIGELAGQGAAGIIAGCTEIGMLVQPDDIDVPFFDTTSIHVAAAMDWALSEQA